MVTHMNDEHIKNLAQVRRFLEGTEALELAIEDKDERYAWMERTLRRFRYRRLNKADRGVVLRYLERVSGYSRQQMTHLVRQYLKRSRLTRRQRTTAGFKTDKTYKYFKGLHCNSLKKNAFVEPRFNAFHRLSTNDYDTIPYPTLLEAAWGATSIAFRVGAGHHLA